jgi:hypothetical protein
MLSHTHPLLRRSIWEKFLAGSEYIFVFLTVHILHHCRMKLLGLYSAKELLQYLVDLKVRTDAAVQQ